MGNIGKRATPEELKIRKNETDYMYKITDSETIKKILTAYRKGMFPSEIARECNVSRQYVNQILIKARNKQATDNEKRLKKENTQAKREETRLRKLYSSAHTDLSFEEYKHLYFMVESIGNKPAYETKEALTQLSLNQDISFEEAARLGVMFYKTKIKKRKG